MAVPTDVATLNSWWQADALTGLADGDPVASWADSSGNSRTAVQTTTSAKPAYRTGVVNGQPVLRFDGGDSITAPTSSSVLPAQTVFAVFSPSSISGTSSAITHPYGGGDGGGLLLRINGGKLQLVKSFVADIALSTTDLATNNFIVVAATFQNASTYAFYINGTVAGSGSTAIYLDTGATGRALGDGLNGDLAEVVVYESVLSGPDRNSITNYLGTKYGITVTGGPPAQAGYSSLGLATSAQQRKVAKTGGTASLGLKVRGSARKVAPGAGTSSVGAAASMADRKIAVERGTAAVGLAATRSGATTRPQAGATASGVASRATARKVAAQGGYCSLGGATAGRPVKVSPSGGSSPVGLSGQRSGTPSRAQAGTCSLGSIGSGRAARTAPARGVSLVGLFGQRSGSASRPASGSCSLGFAGVGATQKTARTVGAICLGGLLASAQRKTAYSSGVAALGVPAAGAGGKRTPGAGRSVLAVAGSAVIAPPVLRGSMRSASRRTPQMAGASRAGPTMRKG